MRKLFLLSVLMFAGGFFADAAKIKDLWHPKKDQSKKVSYKDLWTKPSGKISDKTGSGNTAEKIENSKTILEQTASMQKQMNQQLEKIARNIRKTTLESIAIDKVLKRLEKEIAKSRSSYMQAQKSIKKYGGRIDTLNKAIYSRHQAYLKLLSDQFALLVAAEAQGGNSDVSSIISQETYEAVKKRNTQQMMKLKKEIKIKNNKKNTLLAKQNEIKKSIRSLQAKRELYDKKKKEKKRILEQLAKKEDEYRSRLKEIMQRQKMLRQTLAKLNILRQSEIAEARRLEAQRQAELKRRIALRKKQTADQNAKEIFSTDGQSAGNAAKNVKKYGSSYQVNNIQAYRGAKTISPLPGARVVKKFGSYVDPIYKIRIFNDNIVLKSSVKGAKVRNVLNGKVVYIGENSMLGKVVIVEHGNKLHTIYAALDRISPLLQVGSRVKKGVIIGRIKRKLIFQATQNSKYINPLRLIRL